MKTTPQTPDERASGSQQLGQADGQGTAIQSRPHSAAPNPKTDSQAESATALKSGGGGVRAFSVIVHCWQPNHEGIYAATSAAQAKYRSWKAAQDAGYDTLEFGDFRVRRAPEFDAIVTKLKWGVDREYACLLKFEAERKAGGVEVAATDRVATATLLAEQETALGIAKRQVEHYTRKPDEYCSREMWIIEVGRLERGIAALRSGSAELATGRVVEPNSKLPSARRSTACPSSVDSKETER